MANELKMDKVHAIYGLLDAGWSQRRIARELGVNRETVGRYARIRPKPAISTTGSADGPESKPAISTTGSNPGRVSEYRESDSIIRNKIELGLSRTRIYQDLVCDHGFNGSYSSVKRYVNSINKSSQLPFRRMETPPGEEAQVDYGHGPMITEDGSRRRSYVFRITLSCSRRSYSEPVYRQTTENYIRALENSFRYFGGVPETLVIDNLRAAVKKADWFDPELNPKIIAFMRHYSTTVLPTRPYTPEHKGKVESGIKYVKDNALKGRKFNSLAELRVFLLDWEKTVADTRIHGTTKKQVRDLFESVEREALNPLPAEPFPLFEEGRRRVHRDGHVEVDKSYYSVPPEYLGRTVWARWNSTMVRIFNDHFEQITVHSKRPAGKFSTKESHLPEKKISAVERGPDDLMEKIQRIGVDAHLWARKLLEERGHQGIRVLYGLLSLTRKNDANQINAASRMALEAGMYHLSPLRKLMAEVKKPETALTSEHEIIRPLTEYQLDLFHPVSAADKESS